MAPQQQLCRVLGQRAVDALFEKAAELNLRLGAGKVMADRNMPEGISPTRRSRITTTAKNYPEVAWSQTPYITTPRFAISCTPEDRGPALWMNIQIAICKPTSAKPTRDRIHAGTLSRMQELPRCLRQLWPTWPENIVWPLHPPEERDFQRVSETASVSEPTLQLFLGRAVGFKPQKHAFVWLSARLCAGIFPC